MIKMKKKVLVRRRKEFPMILIYRKYIINIDNNNVGIVLLSIYNY
jgi:hypothetical protein